MLHQGHDAPSSNIYSCSCPFKHIFDVFPPSQWWLYLDCKMANRWDLGWEVVVHLVSAIWIHPMAIITIISCGEYYAHHVNNWLDDMPFFLEDCQMRWLWDESTQWPPSHVFLWGFIMLIIKELCKKEVGSYSWHHLKYIMRWPRAKST